jgi:hypothetical protein
VLDAVLGIPFTLDVQTDRYFWLFFSLRNRLYFVSDAPISKT